MFMFYQKFFLLELAIEKKNMKEKRFNLYWKTLETLQYPFNKLVPQIFIMFIGCLLIEDQALFACI